MKTTLKLAILFFIVFWSYSFADNQKHKDLPPGLQKKVEKGGSLPPGWQKKIRKGQILENDILINGKVISDRYPVVQGTVIYKIEDKVIRLALATKEIVDILK